MSSTHDEAVADPLAPSEAEELMRAPPQPVLLDVYRKRRAEAEEARLERLVIERWKGREP